MSVKLLVCLGAGGVLCLLRVPGVPGFTSWVGAHCLSGTLCFVCLLASVRLVCLVCLAQRHRHCRRDNCIETHTHAHTDRLTDTHRH
jgi:hypothetical protein